MSWQEIHGHDEVAGRFRRAVARGRLASTFLFVGPAGIGKRTFAIRLAKAFLCETHSEAEMNPCGSCAACQQVEADSHPDLIFVAKPSDKSFLPVELFIGDREHRMRAGLCHNIGLKPFRGGRKIAIIDDADYLNQEGANCLLKTLEEPPPNSLIVLIGTSEQKQLPTIRSRCQIVRFQPLPDEVIAQLLDTYDDLDPDIDTPRLVRLGRGSLERALQFADAELLAFRQEFVHRLAALPKDSVKLARDIGAFVDTAGKEAPLRRTRLKVVIEIAVDFYREVTHRLNAVESDADDTLGRASDSAARRWEGDIESAMRCLERCLDAQGQVDANANQATLIECWIDDLAGCCTTAAVP